VRVEVEYEKFAKKVQIESRGTGDLNACNTLFLFAITSMTSLIENVKGSGKSIITRI